MSASTQPQPQQAALVQALAASLSQEVAERLAAISASAGQWFADAAAGDNVTARPIIPELKPDERTVRSKLQAEYGAIVSAPQQQAKASEVVQLLSRPSTGAEIASTAAPAAASSAQPGTAVALRDANRPNTAGNVNNAHALAAQTPAVTSDARLSLIMRQRAAVGPMPEWHPRWRLMRVIPGHTGWVRTIAVDSSNQWFASGSADRTIKIWDLASGTLKLTLTGHINTVRAVCVSDRHPYLFSAGEDQMIKCYDLEQNMVVRQYHGHLSGVYALSLHPTLDVLVSGGRDSVARVWDMRSKKEVAVLGGHTNTVGSIITNAADPQVVTGSHDSTIRLWDLAKQRPISVLTHHKKSVRALHSHPIEFTFASGGADNIKAWKTSTGTFLRNFSGHRAVVNTVAINRSNVLVSGADNGSMYFWDWKSGHCFQQLQTIPQPGSLSAESGIFHATFDQTGSRLLTAEADKTIKVWKESEDSTPETDPITDWNPTSLKRQRQAVS